MLRHFPWWVQLLGAVAAVVALFVLYAVLDAGLKSAFEGVGSSWLHEELGILATGSICFVGGLLLARSITRQRTPPLRRSPRHSLSSRPKRLVRPVCGVSAPAPKE
jgi:hypothetical protein